MSWWVSLHEHAIQEDGSIVDDLGKDVSADDMVQVPSFQEGGTYALGWTNEADLNVTYNYGKHFDFKLLDRQQAKQAIPLLARAVADLGTDKDPDYWKDTPGNAGYACSILLLWALLHPQAYFNVN